MRRRIYVLYLANSITDASAKTPTTATARVRRVTAARTRRISLGLRAVDSCKLAGPPSRANLRIYLRLLRPDQTNERPQPRNP